MELPTGPDQPRRQFSEGAEDLDHDKAADFERLLEQALTSAKVREAMARTPGPDLEQLRTRALRARQAIAAAAEPEYLAYLRSRAAASSTAPSDPRQPPAEAPEGGWRGQWAPALAVLVPVLAGAAAVVLLLLGYALRLGDAGQDVAGQLVTAGWTSGAIAAVVALTGLIRLIAGATGNRSTVTGSFAERREDLERSRAAWQQALVDRGITPFLLGQLRDASSGTADPPLGRSHEVGGEPTT
ncbi:MULTISPECIES: hypothetical protein [Streptomycetaceae]|uniref:Transmembrane protein n=1 Tax=Streptantibioticus cattleyicolor (strain ATCC 35852 / DSM 46488 / JCM 4925 / NBRC 14057 / NRRL 8057) TaxID=1003195 RepID=F8JU00_STREN|nr:MULTISPECIES: hypothetical protein [Streptomycetaceae]AEW98100.1 transmembrane protein [Streptantibioticus cattleyicolor NRRL 8057 = DSM 46488]MYS62494.1 hypothetical protein [Streptomyces sp. SID5468]CCB78416.1 protein of unknown function [Streptantibioticus cattleyicolor NRRL 8057 = DSM 46488]